MKRHLHAYIVLCADPGRRHDRRIRMLSTRGAAQELARKLNAQAMKGRGRAEWGQIPLYYSVRERICVGERRAAQGVS